MSIIDFILNKNTKTKDSLELEEEVISGNPYIKEGETVPELKKRLKRTYFISLISIFLVSIGAGYYQILSQDSAIMTLITGVFGLKIFLLMRYSFVYGKYTGGRFTKKKDRILITDIVLYVLIIAFIFYSPNLIK